MVILINAGQSESRYEDVIMCTAPPASKSEVGELVLAKLEGCQAASHSVS